MVSWAVGSGGGPLAGAVAAFDGAVSGGGGGAPSCKIAKPGGAVSGSAVGAAGGSSAGGLPLAGADDGRPPACACACSCAAAYFLSSAVSSNPDGMRYIAAADCGRAGGGGLRGSVGAKGFSGLLFSACAGGRGPAESL